MIALIFSVIFLCAMFYLIFYSDNEYRIFYIYICFLCLIITLPFGINYLDSKINNIEQKECPLETTNSIDHKPVNIE